MREKKKKFYPPNSERYIDPDRREATCLVRRPENSLWGAEVCSEHYYISERDSAEAAIQYAARRALSHYCSVLGGVADGLNLKYYPRRPSGSTGGVIVSPVGEDNPRLSSTVNLAAVLNSLQRALVYRRTLPQQPGFTLRRHSGRTDAQQPVRQRRETGLRHL